MRIFAHADEHEDFWPAYTDILMVTCLVLILLAATFALSRQDDRIKKEMERRKEAFAQTFGVVLKPQIDQGLVRLISTPGPERQTIVFNDRLLFDKGDAKLKASGVDSLGKVAQLFKFHQEKKPLFERVQVNGHTDPDPIKTREFPSNWHLSGARATSVVYFLVGRGIAPNRLSATGYGQFHPFDPDNHAITDKSKMRRIELVLLYPADWIAAQLKQAEVPVTSR
jgi:chemotaxis protein MotB